LIAFTKEWIEILAEKLKWDEKFQRKAKGFDSFFQFVIDADPANGVAGQRACGLYLPDCNEVWGDIRENTDYSLSGPYKIFHAALTGKTGAVKAITSRKVKVKGKLARLLKYTGAINRMVEVIGEMDSEFEGNYK